MFNFKKKKPLPIFGVESGEDQFFYNSIVQHPANNKTAMFFENDNKRKLTFSNDEEQIIYGVAIEPLTPIFRKANEVSPTDHYVKFSRKEVKKIAFSAFKNNQIQNISFEHNGKQAEGITLVYSFITNNEKGLHAPEFFGEVADGTWLTGYHIEDKEVYNKLKKMNAGFSIEKMLAYTELGTKFNKQDMELYNEIFGNKSIKTELDKEYITSDDLTIYVEGEEIAEGAIVYTVDAEGEKIFLPEGTYTVDGIELEVGLNDEGQSIITKITEATEEAEDAPVEEEMEAEKVENKEDETAKFNADLMKTLKAMRAEFNETLKGIKDENKGLKSELETLKTSFNKAGTKIKFAKKAVESDYVPAWKQA